MSVETQRPEASIRGKVVFADASASVLLSGRLSELSRPAEAGWKQIKQNASRTVYRTKIQGRQAYLKHYHSHSLIHRLGRLVGLSDAKCEMRYSRYLSTNAVAAVPVLAAKCDDGVEWLVTEGVAPAERAHEWHARKLGGGAEGKREIQRAIVALGQLIARMHEIGVIHRDLHTGNILIRTDAADPRCVLMDLHRMRRRRRLSRRARVANLAQIFHDRADWTTRTERLRFLKRYLQVSDVSGTLRGWALMVEEFAWRHRRGLYAQRDRRIASDNRYFARINLGDFWKGHVILASKRNLTDSKAALTTFKVSEWKSALAHPRELLKGDCEVIKDTPSVRIVRRRLTVGGRDLDVYVKSPRRKQAWKIIADCFRLGRAVRAFRMGHALLTRRIPTVLPLVVLERRIGPLRLESMLITETVDAEKLNTFLNKWLTVRLTGDAPLDAAQQRRLGRQVLWGMGRMLQRLHDSSFHHRDLKGPNMLVQWSPGESPQIVLVDLDGLQRVRCMTMRRRFHGLMRLNVSLLRCPPVNHAGRLRMLLGYLRRPGSGRIQFKPYWRVLENWSGRKLREQIHTRRKKQKATRK